MKNFKPIIGCIAFVILISCNSNKKIASNSHGDHSHHESDSHSEDDYFESYTLKDDKYGTSTVVTVKGNQRTMVTNALPNHKTGEFPRKGNPNTISAQKREYTFPVKPKYIGKVYSLF